MRTLSIRAASAWLTPTRLVLACLLFLFLFIDARTSLTVLGAQPPGVDWAPLWAAARLPLAQTSSLYDFALITRAQEPLIGIISGSRPFVYPPTALLIFMPFALLPILLSYLAWTVATGAFYVAAASRLTGQWWLIPLIPPVVLAALIGQTSFLIGGMLIMGLLLIDKRPAYAGIVLGIATTIKPQILILVPFALLVAQNWRALVYWSAGAAGMFLLSLLTFVSGAWTDWLASLPRFQALFEHSPTLIDDSITPYALAVRMGCAGWWIFAAGACLALAGVWGTFRRGASVPDRLVALVGGAILISPYAMHYELTLIAPALVVGADRDIRQTAILLVVIISFLVGLGFLGVAMVMLAMAVNLRHAAPPGA